jgi:hypothetical protein
MSAVGGSSRSLRIVFQPGWDPDADAPAQRGLFSTDPRVKTLVRVLVSYPDVRHVLPDRISLDAAVAASLLETIAHFLGRQAWLVRRVEVG